MSSSYYQPEIIRNRGFVCREYAVTTIDGYILELHRIGESTGHPVLLQHGLLSSSMDWVTNPTDQALGLHYIYYNLIQLNMPLKSVF